MEPNVPNSIFPGSPDNRKKLNQSSAQVIERAIQNAQEQSQKLKQAEEALTARKKALEAKLALTPNSKPDEAGALASRFAPGEHGTLAPNPQVFKILNELKEINEKLSKIPNELETNISVLEELKAELQNVPKE